MELHIQHTANSYLALYLSIYPKTFTSSIGAETLLYQKLTAILSRSSALSVVNSQLSGMDYMQRRIKVSNFKRHDYTGQPELHVPKMLVDKAYLRALERLDRVSPSETSDAR